MNFPYDATIPKSNSSIFVIFSNGISNENFDILQFSTPLFEIDFENSARYF